jgi:hypothetical protein
MCFKLFTQKFALELKKFSSKYSAKQLLLNLVNLVLLTVTLSVAQIANTIDTDHMTAQLLTDMSAAATHSAATRESLFPFGHHTDHIVTATKITHAIATPTDTTVTGISTPSANPTGPISSKQFDIFDMGIGISMGTGVGVGTGYFMNKGNPRTALCLTATSLATIMGTSAFLNHYRTEVKHLKAGFKEISEIKQAQATQAQLLTIAKQDVGASKTLIETTFGVTATTTKQLKDLAAQQELNQFHVRKLDTSIKYTSAQVSQTLAQTQANLVRKLTAQDQALTGAQTTSDNLFKRVFGLDLNKLFKTSAETDASDTSTGDITTAGTTDSKTSERSPFDNYAERWD